MKYAVISDLHGFLPTKENYKIPENIDYLLICGDISPLNIQSNILKMKSWIKNEFIPWCNSIAPITIMVAGNHDFICERCNFNALLPNNIKYLQNSEYITFEGIRIWGTPYCKVFGNWPFMLYGWDLEKKYNECPENIDIIISHDSPHLNEIGTIHDNYNYEDVGNTYLTNLIHNKKPKYFFSGHIHTGNHILSKAWDTYCANVSIKDEKYNQVYDFLTFEI